MTNTSGMNDPSKHYKNTQVAESYDEIRFSSLPGRVFNALEKRTILRTLSDLPKNTVIVDVPCGTGRLAEPLLEAGYRVHGLDISDEMLAVARRRLERFSDRFTTQVANAVDLHSHPDTYRAGLCARVLMHFPLEEQMKILQGVSAIVTERIVINQSLDTKYQRLRRWLKGLVFSSQPTSHPITNADLKMLLSECGLREIKRYRMPRLISEAVYVVAEKIHD